MRKLIPYIFLLFLASPGFAEDEEEIHYENAYYEISPDIVSNLKGGAKYIRTKIQLLTNRADLVYEIDTHAPVIRHVFLMTLIDQNGEKIKTPKGKEALRKELLKAANDALDAKIETKGLLTDLFFTTYFVK